ncbi:MAG: Asp-tRNA(Asn)/Glu-tRNA(Gln) amidotransferase subunit GatB [bacterium]
MKYRPTIGLEVHAELKTRTKMFCDSKNDSREVRPNVNICPICLAHPGTLPTINKEAVRHVLRVGTALGATLADFSEFDRKSYFYPDIPKGYQISQYEHPLVSGGSLNGVAITRVHLEEDTARSTHGGDKSLVDFNRAGVPLMELVTEPVIHDAETAGAFARELQLLLRTLGASDANLEQGEMRIEANISVSDSDAFGTKVEVKNLNSFRSVERAIAYELDRQSKLIDSGGKVVQETRGWDETKQETFHQRFKEGSADYRYFPEPDLPKLVLSEVPEFSYDALAASLPELPWIRRERYVSLGLKPETVEMFLQEENKFLRAMFEGVAELTGSDADLMRLAGNYIASDIVGLLKDADARGSQENLSTTSFLALMRMIKAGDVSSRGAKDVLMEMYVSGGEPMAIATEKGLIQVHDENVLAEAVRGVIGANPEVVAQYRAGKEASLQFLVGAAMKATKGAGNPGKLRDLLATELAR